MGWNTSGPPILEGEDERELKRQFAAFLVDNPTLQNEAGYSVFPGSGNHGRAFQANAAWPHDPFVRAEMRRLRGEGEAGDEAILLPSKTRLVQMVYERAAGADDKEALGFFKLAAEICGFVSKAPLVDNRTINVLRVPTRDVTPEDDADFDVKFEAQQTKLIADARARPIAA